VRFLVDNALSPLVAKGLCDAGHDAVHVSELGLAAATDEVLFDRALQDQRIVLSADTDFGTLLAARRSAAPSVCLFRHGIDHRPAVQVAVLLANLGALTEALAEGAVVAIEPTRLRIRRLPIA
jgi:predicted nuclease of predicted toxin-antitoxin system